MASDISIKSKYNIHNHNKRIIIFIYYKNINSIVSEYINSFKCNFENIYTYEVDKKNNNYNFNDIKNLLNHSNVLIIYIKTNDYNTEQYIYIFNKLIKYNNNIRFGLLNIEQMYTKERIDCYINICKKLKNIYNNIYLFDYSLKNIEILNQYYNINIQYLPYLYNL